MGKNTEEVWDDIKQHDGSVQHIEWLTDHQKNVYKCGNELDQHWLIELANVRGQYLSQTQSLNVFFPAGASREYVNSVHLKFLKSENVLTMYYLRTEREGKTDTVKIVERKALEDWKPTDESVCKSCEG